MGDAATDLLLETRTDSESTPSAASLRRLVRAVRDLAAAQDLDGVVDVVRHAARELVDADGATFVLRDEGQCYYVDEDAIEPLWRGQRFPLEACISGWAMLNSEQVVIPDIYLDDRIPHVAYRPTFVHSLVMTPIRTEEPVGSIGTYWAHEHTATVGERELLQALADSTSVAMEKIRVLEGLEASVAERTSELEATNRDLKAFAHVAAHDLKAPLATIVASAELIEDTDGDSLSSDGANALGLVGRQTNRMAALIDSVLSYSTAATTPMDTGTVDLGEITLHVLRDLADLISSSQATIELGDLPSVQGSGPLLERVVQNLVVNAIRYGNKTHPVVVIEATNHGKTTSYSVSDNGPGVAAEEHEAIFDMFVRGKASVEAPGSGIGLAFARRVVERHHGTLSVSESALGGACFTMTLPV